MRHIGLFLLLVFSSLPIASQSLDQRLRDKEVEQQTLKDRLAGVMAEVEDLKLGQVRKDLLQVGLPEGQQIRHSAMILSYSEEHEQAKWVAHIIRPEVTDGRGVRSHDFREDPLVATGSAVETDYFLKYLQADSTFTYDGFGWDRGHLAPSADFRWSERALSESFLYSNMSPQLDDFNRDGWANLEGLLRGYVARTGRQLVVVTGGVLKEGLPVIERGVNKVSIPGQFYEVVLDLEGGKAVGFLMPNEKLRYPIEHYAVSVDAVEALTGLDFFG
jgi:endonuclease G